MLIEFYGKNMANFSANFLTNIRQEKIYFISYYNNQLLIDIWRGQKNEGVGGWG